MALTWQDELGEILRAGYPPEELERQLAELIENEKMLSLEEGKSIVEDENHFYDYVRGM